MATKRGRSSSPSSASNIFRSSSIEEQKSIFIAAYSPSLPAKALQALPEFRTASHKIAAWRKPSRQKSLMPESKIIYDLGHDDDGEKWAGGRLSNVLRDTETEGVVVVARWYGGQNIGPIRFTHIENCAKEAIWKWKTADAEAKNEQAAKKQKVDEDAKRQEFIRELQERDYNIFALRKLLSEKKARLHDEDPVPPTPQKPQAYDTMKMDALKRVDKARDATVAFILKQIDQVDDELKLVEALEDDPTQDSWRDEGVPPTQDKDEAPSTPKAN
ncbi:hypothetical protein IQ07DRAFT_71400 [Pyrenochaeta sp. DS3sAY3a]|nr:hypothetical protein IQ07DRAFT_71400 [Pyrenochaeta sp. DS3sAY3a]